MGDITEVEWVTRFHKFLEAYPSTYYTKHTLATVWRRIPDKSEALYQQIIEAAQVMAKAMKKQRREKQYITRPKTFLEERMWEEDSIEPFRQMAQEPPKLGDNIDRTNGNFSTGTHTGAWQL